MKLFLILLLSLLLSACGGGEDPDEPTGPDLPPKLDCTKPGMCT